jgi:hypothetical protein
MVMEDLSWYHDIEEQAVFSGSGIVGSIPRVIKSFGRILKSIQACFPSQAVVSVVSFTEGTACWVSLRTDTCDRAIIDNRITAFWWYWECKT